MILETIAGTCRVREACARLGLCEQRFHQLRAEALTAALQALEPGTPGPKPQTPSPAQKQVEGLADQVATLEVELAAAKAREEIALTIPRLVPSAPAEKKTPRSPPSTDSRCGRKKNT